MYFCLYLQENLTTNIKLKSYANLKQWRILTSPGYRRGACANKPGGTQVSWRAPSEVCAVSWQWRVVFLSLWTGEFPDMWVRGATVPMPNDCGPRCPLGGVSFPQIFLLGPIARLFSQFEKDLAAAMGTRRLERCPERGPCGLGWCWHSQGLTVRPSLVSSHTLLGNGLVIGDQAEQKRVLHWSWA